MTSNIEFMKSTPLHFINNNNPCLPERPSFQGVGQLTVNTDTSIHYHGPNPPVFIHRDLEKTAKSYVYEASYQDNIKQKLTMDLNTCFDNNFPSIYNCTVNGKRVN